MDSNDDEPLTCIRPKFIPHHEKVVDVDINRLNEKCTHEQRYINLTAVPITILGRSGLATTLPPMPSGELNPGLYIVHRTNTGNGVKFDSTYQFNEPENEITEELKQYRTSSEVSNFASMTSAHVIFKVTVDDIERSGGSVYLNKSDIVASVLDAKLCPKHPYSDAGINYVRTSQITGDSCQLQFYIVDNRGTIGSRYINFNGIIFKIKAIQDRHQKDGLYFIGNSVVKDEEELGKPQTYYFTPSEIDDKDRFKTAFSNELNAVKYGDPYESIEREHQQLMATLKRDIESQKIENEQMQLANKKLQAQLDEKNSLIKSRELERKAQLDELEHLRTMTAAKQKDYYEDRSYIRKDTNEIFKHIPTIILAILTSIVAFTAKSK